MKGVKNTFSVNIFDSITQFDNHNLTIINLQSIGDWFGDKADDAKDASSDLYDDAKSGVKDISKKIS